HRVLGVNRRPGCPALDRSTARDELNRGHLNWIRTRTYHHEPAVWAQTVNQLGHRSRVRGCRYNHLCAAELLQLFGSVRRFAVDGRARWEFLGGRRVFGAAPYSRDLISKLVRELDSEVTQTPAPLDRHKVAGVRTAVPQCVEGGNAGAQQRGGFGVTQSR